MELARDASVGEMLGNLFNASSQYEKARLLVESVLMTTESSSDKKILQSFAETFAQQQNHCRLTNENFQFHLHGR